MRNKINIAIFVSGLILGSIIAGSLFLRLPKPYNLSPQPTLTPAPSPAVLQRKYPDTKDWSIYLNYKLGIAFRFPRYTAAGQTLFVQAGDILFITNSSSPVFIHREELKRLKSDMEIIETTKQITASHELPAGTIFTKTIHSNADLERLIHFRYGQGCRLGSLQDATPQNSQTAVYNVDIAPVTPGIDGWFTSSCALNWVNYFKYSPQYKLAAVWDIGQESYLHTDTCPGIPECSIDQGIAESVFFIEPTSTGYSYIDSVVQDE